MPCIDAYGYLAMAYADKLKQADPKGSFLNRRKPRSTGPKPFKEHYKNRYLVTDRKLASFPECLA